MLLFILAAVIVVAVVWWLKGERALSRNEELYLKRRGYDPGDDEGEGPPIARDARLFNLLESLGDVSPYSRQKAAEELSRMCSAGQRDSRMYSSLVTALDDKDSSVRSAVVSALGNLGDARGIEKLRLLKEKDASIQVRAAAQSALEKLEAGKGLNAAREDFGLLESDSR